MKRWLKCHILHQHYVEPHYILDATGYKALIAYGCHYCPKRWRTYFGTLYANG